MVVCVSGLLALLTPSQQTDTDMDPSHHSAGAAVDSATAQHSSPREEEEEFTEETFDYILELPQLDLYPDIDFDRFPVSVLGAATDRPVLHMGDCVFHGKHEFMIGTSLVFSLPSKSKVSASATETRAGKRLRPRVGGSGNDEEEEEGGDWVGELEDDTHPQSGADASEEGQPKLLARTSRKIVFHLASGSIEGLKKQPLAAGGGSRTRGSAGHAGATQDGTQDMRGEDETTGLIGEEAPDDEIAEETTAI